MFNDEEPRPKYTVQSLGAAYFQVSSWLLAKETARGVSLREYGRTVEVLGPDGVTVAARYLCGEITELNLAGVAV